MSIEEIENRFRGKTGPEVALICQDLDVLGIGGRRAVIRDGQGGAWKIPWQEGGERDNEIEWRLWSGASPELRSLLCPARQRYSASLCQAECVPISFEAAGRGGREIVAELARWGISDAAINLGVLDKKLVCYDYSFVSPAVYESLFGLS